MQRQSAKSRIYWCTDIDDYIIIVTHKNCASTTSRLRRAGFHFISLSCQQIAIHASRKPRNCGPFAFISVIMRNRAEVRCSTRCTRACCVVLAEFSRQGEQNAGKPSIPHLASDGWTAISWHICSLGGHQRSFPA